MTGEKNTNHLLILTIYIALKPIYLWSSGSVQIGDFFLMLGFLYLIVSKSGRIKLDYQATRLMGLLTAIVFYQALINGIWTFALDENLMRSSLYYVFNMLSVLITLIILQNVDRAVAAKYILMGCFISIAITSVGLFVRMGGIRRLGFFNNPNQLGYHALIILSLLLYFFNSAALWQKISIGAMSIWAIMTSGSKAAFLGAVVLIFLKILFGNARDDRTMNKLIVQLSILFAAVFALYLLLFSNSSIISSNRTLLFVRWRILTLASENDSALGAGRGYDRVFEMGHHFLWGMGEGAYSRFNSMNELEAHSSYVTILVSYGLIGFIAYVVLIWKFIAGKRELKYNLVVLSGIFAYAFTHNGLRNTLLWIFLAIIFSLRYGKQSGALPGGGLRKD